MDPINIHDAKTQLSKLIRRVEAGEEIILSRSGRPVARLIPIEPNRPRQPGLLSGRLDDAFFDELPAGELDAWDGA